MMAQRQRTKEIGCFLYLFFWCLYWLQGMLFPSGSIVSQTILAGLLFVSLISFIVANLQYKLPSVLKVMSLIVFLFMIYGVYAIIKGERFVIEESGTTGVTAMGTLKNSLISLLPIYSIYIATIKGVLTEKALRKWTIVFFWVAVVCFYESQSNTMILLGRDEVTNNSAYSVLAIIVLLPIFNKKTLVQYIILAVCLFYVLIGMKRGAFVCGIVATIWFLYYSLRSVKKSVSVIKVFILTIAIIFLALYVFNYMLESSDYFNIRIESTLTGGSSPRNEMYSLLFNHFINETSPLRFLFGNGANATLKISMNYAHNDWLEMAINNGLIMVILYFIYWVRMFKTIRRTKDNNMVFMMLSLFFVIYFLKSFFSMSYGDIPTWASTALGFALARSSESLKIK